eukprot:142433-Pyramimonas_sp.AAC.2
MSLLLVARAPPQQRPPADRRGVARGRAVAPWARDLNYVRNQAAEARAHQCCSVGPKANEACTGALFGIEQRCARARGMAISPVGQGARCERAAAKPHAAGKGGLRGNRARRARATSEPKSKLCKKAFA